MGFRFRRRIKIAPGVRLNVGKTGFTSMSIGGRGMTMNVGAKGVRTTVGIPGTGLSYTSSPSVANIRANHKPATVAVTPARSGGGSRKGLKIIGTLVLAIALGAGIHWLVGLVVGGVLLWVILRSDRHANRHLSVPAAAIPIADDAGDADEVEVQEPTGAEPVVANSAQAAEISHGWERLRLTAATKLCSAPDAGSGRLGLLPAGTAVTVLDRRPGWMFVQDDAGIEGWARDQHWALA
jgi:hypothetical protein